MAKARKDDRGRALRKGEVQRASDKRYMYTYTDPLGRRKFIYAQDLATLREKEEQLVKDQLDGLDVYVSGKATGALDSKTTEEIMSVFENMNESSKTIIIVIHDKDIAAKCRRVIEIADGRIVSDSKSK